MHIKRTNVPGVYAAGDVVLGLDQVIMRRVKAGVAARRSATTLAASNRSSARLCGLWDFHCG